MKSNFLAVLFVFILSFAIFAEEKKIILTFDDCGRRDVVIKFLDFLKNPGENLSPCKVIFFLNGDWARKNIDLVVRMRNDGHFLGNHTYNHENLTTLSNDKIRWEIKYGVKSTLLRPPFGAYNSRVEKIANEMGCEIYMWDIDSRDWTGRGAEAMEVQVLKEMEDESVVLFHLHGKHTLEAIKSLVPKIYKAGYKIEY